MKPALKSSKTPRQAPTPTRKPLYDAVEFHGAAVVVRKGRRRILKIFNSEKEAIREGIPPKLARQLFLGFFGANNCVVTFGWMFGVSCDGSDDCAAGKTCFLQKYDPQLKAWVDHGGTSSASVGNFIWRCRCK